MTDCIAIIDIGKTNKKVLLFDTLLNIIYNKSIQFQEIEDDDGYPCDDIEAIEKWMFSEIRYIQSQEIYNLKALNFSTHGATVVYLDKEGNRVAPVYNYLKTLDKLDFKPFYDTYGGVENFSRTTASPAYGMLNSGMQMYWLKYVKPHLWEKVDTILHYPQYLSYLFTKKITTDYTSIGAHTGLWNFDKMDYHEWLNNEQIQLPKIENNSEAITAVSINGQNIVVGNGLHDSSASIVPLLKKNKEKFILLSTGTWIICMNPFSKEKLTLRQLKKNCLCFMTPDKQQIKSSMRFLGHAHELYVEALSAYFSVDIDTHKSLKPNKIIIQKTIHTSKTILLPQVVDSGFKVDLEVLESFSSYEKAYSQLLFEISYKVIKGVKLILDKNHNSNKTNFLYLSGGFNKNKWFIDYIKLLMPHFTLEISDIKNQSALGAAMLMKKYIC